MEASLAAAVDWIIGALLDVIAALSPGLNTWLDDALSTHRELVNWEVHA